MEKSDAVYKTVPYFLLLACVGAAVTCIISKSASSREPSYHGKSYTSWLEDYTARLPLISRGGSDNEERQAYLALRQIGTNGLATLVKLSKATDSGLPGRLRSFVERHLSTASGYRNAELKHRLAYRGFELLGPAGRPAVHKLMSLLRSRDHYVRESAIKCLGEIGSGAEEAVPALIEFMNDPGKDSEERMFSLFSLQRIHKGSDIVVMALIQNIGDGRITLGTLALTALDEFGADAKPAVPAIRQLLNDPDPDIRFAATSAVLGIERDIVRREHMNAKGPENRKPPEK